METLSTGGAAGMWKRLALLEQRRQFDLNREERLAKERNQQNEGELAYKNRKLDADIEYRNRTFDEGKRQYDLNRGDKRSDRAEDVNYRRDTFAEGQYQYNLNRGDKRSDRAEDVDYRNRTFDEGKRQYDLNRGDKRSDRAEDVDYRNRTFNVGVEQKERELALRTKELDRNYELKLTQQRFDNEWADILNSQKQETMRIENEKHRFELDNFHKQRVIDEEKENRRTQMARSAMGLVVNECVMSARDSDGDVLLSQSQMEYLRKNSGGLLENIVGCTTYKDSYGEVGLVVTFSDSEKDANGKDIVDENGKPIPRMWNLSPQDVRRILNASNYGDEKMTNQMIGSPVEPQHRVGFESLNARTHKAEIGEDGSLTRDQVNKLFTRLRDINKLFETQKIDGMTDRQKIKLMDEAEEIREVLANGGYAVPNDNSGSARKTDSAPQESLGRRRLGKDDPSAGNTVTVQGVTIRNGQIINTKDGRKRAIVVNGKLTFEDVH